MARKKMSRADRKLLKRAGFGREFKEMGALESPGSVCAPDVALCAGVWRFSGGGSAAGRGGV